MKFFRESRKVIPGRHFWHFIYFHGDAEQLSEQHIEDGWTAPDLVASDTSQEGLEDGIHKGTLYDMPVTVYIWSLPRQYGENMNAMYQKGLICLDSDTKSCADAQHAFDAKRIFI